MTDKAKLPKFEIDFLDDYTNEALLGEIRRIAALLPVGGSLTRTAWGRHCPKVAHTNIRRRFGGWKEALELAGLGHLYVGQPVSQKMRSQVAKELSNADLISELRRVFALVGQEWLTSEDFNAHSVTSEDAVRSRFGTFGKGLDAAGIPRHPRKVRQFTDQECFENIVEVWTHYGRPPQYREMFRAPSRVLGKTYVTRWGTWRKTLRAFVNWANTNGEPKKTDEREPNEMILLEPTKWLGGAQADCREVRPGLRFKVFMRDRFRCLACGRSPATHLNVELHADHILAVANGGKTTLENLQTLCQDCNLGKGRTVVT
jgi:hypothetical protein